MSKRSHLSRTSAPGRAGVAGIVGAATLLFAGAARADEEGVRRGARLAWVRGVGADGCVGKLGLEEDVKARLGYDPFALSGDISVEGTIVRIGGGFRADLVVRDASGSLLGTRQLTSREETCRTLGEAVAVAITIALDPNASGTRKASGTHEEEVGAPDVEASSEGRGPATPAPTAGAPNVERHPMRGRIAAGAGASAGLLPGLTPVVSLRAHGSVGARWELGVGAQLWGASRTSGMSFGLTTASVDVCVVPLDAARALRWCAGAHFGFLHVFVHSPELTPVTVGMVPWTGAETGPSLSLPLAGPWHLEAGISAMVPITRKETFVRGLPDVVWKQSVVAGRADLGLGATF